MMHNLLHLSSKIKARWVAEANKKSSLHLNKITYYENDLFWIVAIHI